jgi:hypothetical protein
LTGYPIKHKEKVPLNRTGQDRQYKGRGRRRRKRRRKI